MYLKKTLLAAAVALTLSACDGGLTGDKQAEQTEHRFRDLVEKSEAVVVPMLSERPPFAGFTFKVKDYQRGAQNSTATRELQLILDQKLMPEELAGRPIAITVKDKIDHSDALAKEKILAKVESQLEVDSEVLAAWELSGEADTIAAVLSNVQVEEVLYHDDKVQQTLKVLPIDKTIDHGAEAVRLSYEGLTFTSQYKQSDLTSPIYPSTGELKSGKFAMIGDQGNRIELEPFSGQSKSDKNGTFEFTTDAIRFSADVNDNPFSGEIGSLGFYGKDVSYDDKLRGFIGKQTLVVNNIRFGDNEDNISIALETVEFGSTTEKNGEFYNGIFNSVIKPQTDLLKNFFGMGGLKINETRIEVRMNHFSAETIRLMEKMQYAQGSSDTHIKNIEKMLVDFAANQGTFDLDIGIDTEAGKATAVAHIGWQEGVTAEALANLEPDEILNFAEVDATVRIPRSLVAATGMEGIAQQMAGEFFAVEGEDFVLKAQVRNGELSVNGKSFK